ncbi:MAG TPA: hypothetical protein VKF63_01610 [Terracidiphilus sp.]|nr:hypothetical protein [Terracidiphilus sp.]
MANKADTQDASATNSIFTKAHCRSLTYFLDFKPAEFELADFEQATNRFAGRALCSPKSDTSGYHLHVSWRKRKDRFSVQVEFIPKGRKIDTEEQEPFAEEFFPWLSQFVASEEPRRTHLHAEFCYPAAVGKVGPFPLPLGTALGPRNVDVKIDGISLTVTPSVDGVEKIWVTQRPKEFLVYLIGERPIHLKTFDLASEVSALSKAWSLVFRERKQ